LSADSVKDYKWYVLHTYSGYENKVANDILTIVDNRNLKHLIRQVHVPTETHKVVREVKKVDKYTGVETIGKSEPKEIQVKLFPGYVYVYMHKTDETWYICRNARGVTGFLGFGNDPVPLSEDEVKQLKLARTPDEQRVLRPGMRVDIKDGSLPFGMSGENVLLKEIDTENGTIKVDALMFGGTTEFALKIEDIKD
jgi:transcriptional antiterminator NusG